MVGCLFLLLEFEIGTGFVTRACFKLTSLLQSLSTGTLDHHTWIEKMSWEEKSSILDKINLTKQYLTVVNVLMSSENLEDNKRERKKKLLSRI